MCARERVNSKETLLPTEFPDRPWSKVGIELFQFNDKQYLIVVDYFSRFFKIAKLTSTTPEAVIENIKSIFAHHSIAETVQTDNGPQFSSGCFRVFASQWKFSHATSSPLFPQSNGEVERAVRTAEGLKVSQESWRPIASLDGLPRDPFGKRAWPRRASNGSEGLHTGASHPDTAKPQLA